MVRKHLFFIPLNGMIILNYFFWIIKVPYFIIKDHSVDKLAILKNNKVEAVVISKDEYESMKEALKEVEAKKILTSIKKGLKDVKDEKTHSIDTLWNQLDDWI